MTLTRRRVGLWLGLFVVVLALGAWPSPRVALTFSALFSPLANTLMARHTFGTRGHAQMVPLPAITRRPSDNVSADAMLLLSVEGYDGALPLGVSLRRDVYLPLLIVVSLIICSPLPMRRRLWCLGLALPITLLAGTAANALVVAWTFLTELKGVYAPSPQTMRVAQLVYGAVMVPPGNRFIAPLALGISLIAWQWPRPPSSSTRPRGLTASDAVETP